MVVTRSDRLSLISTMTLVSVASMLALVGSVTAFAPMQQQKCQVSHDGDESFGEETRQWNHG